MRALIIGGTRNLGPSIVQALLEHGADVTIFNRGQTPDDLPHQVRRLRGDRSDPAQLKAAVGPHEFDIVIDTTLYSEAEAQAVVELFSGRVKRYIFLSTGQVYLLRLGLKRPFKEVDYEGPTMAPPPRDYEIDYRNWLYGHEKRQAEDVFAAAWTKARFPYTSLRLPMVHSERDHYHRIYGYIRRLQDGGPILIPEGPGLPVQHVYGGDVVQAILRLLENDKGKGEAYNIGQDESVPLEEFLQMLAGFVHAPLRIVRVPRETLEQSGLLPDCSPFSGRWMSALENTRSKSELAMQYTPLAVYLEKLARFFARAPRHEFEEYSRRAEELELARSLACEQDSGNLLQR
jgi:nucleoside-diphosphate-sugar epimerase